MAFIRRVVFYTFTAGCVSMVLLIIKLTFTVSVAEEKIVSENAVYSTFKNRATTIATADSEVIQEVDFSSKISTDARYILPIGITRGGPNFQYKHFKIATRFAIYLNRTIVLTPFLRHRLRTKENLVDFEETFDVEKLSSLVSVASLDEYRRECGDTAETVLAAPHLSPHPIDYYMKTYNVAHKMFQQLLDLSLPLDLCSHDEEESIACIHATYQTKCLAMYYPYNFFNWTIPNQESLSASVSRSLKRAPPITDSVVYARNVICEGAPYVAFHWRNKTGEQCTIGNRAESHDPRCSSLLGNMLSSGGEQMAKTVYDVMEKHGINCIYVAYLPYSESVIKILKKVAPSIRIYTASDVGGAIPSYLSAVVSDPYMFSLLEQQICYDSDIFIGGAYSNWSEFVFDERDAEERQSYHLNELPGIPFEIATFQYL